MLRDITLGQYYPADSVIHRLDPRVKLFGTLVYLVTLFLTDNFIGYLLALLFLAVTITVSKVPVSFILRGLKAVMVLLLFSVVLNLFMTKGEVVFSVWKISVTKEGIYIAAFMAIRILFLIMGSSIMTLTTTPNNLTDGLEKGLGFLKIFRVPVHEIAMMMSIALRFIPILMEETDKIMKAQMARGADFESKKLTKKVKALIPLLVPLFVSAFRRANDLATAMEARCYRGGKGRTKMKPLVYKKRDVLAYLIIFGYLAAVILIKIYF
ncbi:MAG: energy-coupling factor transporter transmembrane protein EcfT [Lachnospiraceae bacterium]|nr:energy-coupling factor transporter transmembrane protein EcfT [Lachnospiraceae bacterium]